MSRWLILGPALILASCVAAPPPPVTELEFLTLDACENTGRLRSNLDQALQAFTPAPTVHVVDLNALPASDVRRGYPTPTILVNNVELFGIAEPKPPLPDPT